MVRCKISAQGNIGPHFNKRERVTSNSYSRLHCNLFFPKLPDYPTDETFQADGALSHSLYTGAVLYIERSEGVPLGSRARAHSHDDRQT